MPVSFGLYKNFRASEFRDPGVIFGDYFVFNYRITDGLDLDTRFRFLSPFVSEYVGWGKQERITYNGRDIAFWGGDNTGTGQESVYIDRTAFFEQFPSSTSLEVDMRGFWYTTVGANPVILNMDAYQGGSMKKNGFLWENSTALNRFPSARSFPNNLSFKTQNADSEGQRIARAIIDFDAASVTYYAI